MNTYKKEKSEQNLMLKRALGELFEKNTPFKTNSYVEESLLELTKRWNVNVDIGEVNEYFRLLMLEYVKNPERFYSYEELMMFLDAIVKERREPLGRLVFQNEDDGYKIIKSNLTKRWKKEYN